MALSGSTYTAFKDHRLVFEWSASQSIPSNTSTVTARVYLQGMQSWSTLYAPAMNNGSITVNGSTQSFSANSNLTGTQKKLLATKTFSVGHAANGTKSFNFSATYNVNVNYNGYVGNVTVKGSGTLNNIPRAASISVLTGNLDYGQAVKWRLGTVVSGFRYVVKLTLPGNSQTWEYSGTGGNGDKSWTIPVGWMSAIPSSTTGNGVISVTTYSGSSNLGTNSGKFTAKVPTSIVPTINSVTYSESNSKVSSVLGNIGQYLQSMSIIDYKMTSSGVYGSSISSSVATIAGVPSKGATGKIYLSQVPNSYGSVAVDFEVMDSRGRRTTKRETITILQYEAPKITSIIANRDNGGKGGNVIIQRTGGIFPIMVGGKDINKLTSKVEMKQYGAASFTTVNSGTTFGNVSIPNVSVIYSYDFRVTLADSFSEVASDFVITTAKTLFHLHKDIGVGIGTMHTRGVLDVNGASYFDGETNIDGNTSIKGTTKLDGKVNVTADLVIEREGQLIVSPNRFASTTSSPAVNFSNSDVFGLNGIYFGGPGSVDPADNDGEGLLFPRTGTSIPEDGKIDRSSGWDTFRVKDGEGFLNGKLVFIEDSSKILWQGVFYMTETHIVKPSRHLEGCPNGWVLQWSGYANGAAQNYDYNYTIIHKGHRLTASGAGTYHTMSNSQSSSCGKYIYASNDRLQGHKNNSTGISGSFVLRRVYAF